MWFSLFSLFFETKIILLFNIGGKMTEKDFAKMTKGELEKHCEELEKELAKAHWFLRNKIQQEQDKKGE